MKPLFKNMEKENHIKSYRNEDRSHRQTITSSMYKYNSKNSIKRVADQDIRLLVALVNIIA